MIDMRTNSDTYSSDPIPPHIHSIHQFLIQQKIITHPGIVNCSQQWIKNEEKDIPNPSKSQRLKRCHYVNHCPICNHLRKHQVHAEMTPYRQVLLDNGGKNILLTFTLRHIKFHFLVTLQEVLTESIKKLKVSSPPWTPSTTPSKTKIHQNPPNWIRSVGSEVCSEDVWWTDWQEGRNTKSPSNATSADL